MKFCSLITISLLSMVSISCVKTKMTTIDMPEIKTVEPVIKRKSGLKCHLLGATEQKEIFLKLAVKDGKQTITFHDFIDANRVSILGATIEGYKTFSFELTETIIDDETIEGDETKVSIGNSSIFPSTEVKLNEDEGRIITSNGKLTLDSGYRGQLEVSHWVINDELKNKHTPFEELAKIEACDKFEAIMP
jgi:hypothetical protein